MEVLTKLQDDVGIQAHFYDVAQIIIQLRDTDRCDSIGEVGHTVNGPKFCNLQPQN